MIRALIVDDEPLPRERIRSLLESHGEIEVVGECEDGEEAVTAIEAESPDLVFLDIQMPELDGFEVVSALRSEQLPAIIFVTAYDEYAIKAFEVDAIDYLLKPVSPERFEQALERATSRLATHATPESNSKLFDFLDRVRAERGFVKRFVVRKGSKLSFVRIADVDWIDVTSNYIRLHVAGTRHLVRQTLKSVEGQLDPDVFIRVHRSIIINVDRVESVEPHLHGEYEVTMQDGTRFTTSRSYSSRLRALLR